MNKKIIIAKRNSITKENKKLLMDNGYIIIEASEPSEVRVLSGTDMVSGDDLFMSAIDALNCEHSTSGVKAAFLLAVTKRIKEKEKPKQ